MRIKVAMNPLAETTTNTHVRLLPWWPLFASVVLVITPKYCVGPI